MHTLDGISGCALKQVSNEPVAVITTQGYGYVRTMGSSRFIQGGQLSEFIFYVVRVDQLF